MTRRYYPTWRERAIQSILAFRELAVFPKISRTLGAIHTKIRGYSRHGSPRSVILLGPTCPDDAVGSRRTVLSNIRFTAKMLLMDCLVHSIHGTSIQEPNLMPRLALRPLTLIAILALMAVVVGAQAPVPRQ